MNREIKFRAFDKEQGKFIYSDSKYGIASFWDSIYNDFTNQFEYPQEYTGLKDKNSKEIYEGDIVKGGNDFDGVKDKISFIEYRANSFMVDAEQFGWEGELLWDWEDIEVIGNIYENPELLNK